MMLPHHSTDHALKRALMAPMYGRSQSSAALRHPPYIPVSDAMRRDLRRVNLLSRNSIHEHLAGGAIDQVKAEEFGAFAHPPPYTSVLFLTCRAAPLARNPLYSIEITALNSLNDAPRVNDPAIAADAGNSFLMRHWIETRAPYSRMLGRELRHGFHRTS
jgi:hypothetical protein